VWGAVPSSKRNTFFDNWSEEDKQMLHCRIRAQLNALAPSDLTAFAEYVGKNCLLTHAFQNVCDDSTCTKFLLSEIPALPDGPEKHRRQIYARLRESPIGCSLVVEKRQTRSEVLKSDNAWITLQSGELNRDKVGPVHVVTGASGSGKSVYCAFQMVNDLTQCPDIVTQRCTIVLTPGKDFNDAFKAAVMVESTKQNMQREEGDTDIDKHKQARNAVCVRTVVAAVSRALRLGDAKQSQTLDASSVDEAMENGQIQQMDRAVQDDGPLRDVAVLVVIDEVGESTQLCHGVCAGRKALFEKLLTYFGAVQVVLCGTGAWQLGTPVAPGTEPDSYTLTDLSAMDGGFVTKLADCFPSHNDVDRGDPLYRMMATNARAFYCFLEALEEQCPPRGDAARDDPRTLRSLPAAANRALGRYLKFSGLRGKPDKYVRRVAQQALAAVMLQKHEVAADANVRGLLTSQSYDAKTFDGFLKEHPFHPAAAKIKELKPPLPGQPDTRCFVVLDIVPALLLLICSAFGGVDVDVVRSPDALERFGALYLHARMEALLYCAETESTGGDGRKLIEPAEFVSALLAPFQSGGLNTGTMNARIPDGMILKQMVLLEQPFPPTRGDFQPPSTLELGKLCAQVVVNGPRAPFADAWLSLPLADGRRLFLAVQAKHVSKDPGKAKCSVADECVTAGLLSDLTRLSKPPPNETEREGKRRTDAYQKVQRSHSAWTRLCGDTEAPIVYLVFVTNGTFEAAAQNEMNARSEVCFFDRHNVEALVPFAGALPLLRASAENGALNDDDDAAAAQ